MIPKKGSRSITIDDRRYRWLLRRKPTQRHQRGDPVHVAVAAEDGRSTLLIQAGTHPSNRAELYGVSVTPSDVRRWIEEAVRGGWDPDTPGTHRTRGLGAARAYRRHTRPIDLAEATRIATQIPVCPLSRTTDGSNQVCVDGVPLLDRVQAAVRGHVEHEIEQRVADGEPRELLMGLSDYMPELLMLEDDEEAHRRVFFDCSCGNIGCWPLTASVFVLDEHVVWCDFEQVHRDWIIELGPFVFDREPYERVLAKTLESR